MSFQWPQWLPRRCRNITGLYHLIDMGAHLDLKSVRLLTPHWSCDSLELILKEPTDQPYNIDALNKSVVAQYIDYAPDHDITKKIHFACNTLQPVLEARATISSAPGFGSYFQRQNPLFDPFVRCNTDMVWGHGTYNPQDYIYVDQNGNQFAVTNHNPNCRYYNGTNLHWEMQGMQGTVTPKSASRAIKIIHRVESVLPMVGFGVLIYIYVKGESNCEVAIFTFP